MTRYRAYRIGFPEAVRVIELASDSNYTIIRSEVFDNASSKKWDNFLMVF